MIHLHGHTRETCPWKGSLLAYSISRMKDNTTYSSPAPVNIETRSHTENLDNCTNLGHKSYNWATIIKGKGGGVRS